MAENLFTSEHWAGQLQQIELPGGPETVLNGQDRDFTWLREPFADIKELVVVGYSSQGPAHAMNLRDSFKAGGVSTRVSVALREGSATRVRAEADGFTVANGTLVTPEVGLARAEFALMLISDAGMATDGERLLSYLPKGATVGLAHGFYLGLRNGGKQIRDDLCVVGVCPKGMGPSVRRLYEQGAGINASAAWQDGDDRGRDLALAWSYGIGAPFTFRTTLDSERQSDLVGERAILLGEVHGIVEAVYQQRRNQGVEPAEAYKTSVESLVRGISTTISERSLRGLYESFGAADRAEFARVYNVAYPGLRAITQKIYRDVQSGREVDEVVEDGVYNAPMSNIAATEMWQVGAKLRADDAEGLAQYTDVDVTVAALYTAGMMAQIDVLQTNGHHWSEIINESVIEAIDSLNPFMRARGAAFMIDNCSVTARRGARKWAPLFQAWLMQEVFPRVQASGADVDADTFSAFLAHPAHEAFTALSQLRPAQSIAVE